MRPRAKRASRKIVDVALRAPDTGLAGHPEAIVAKIQRKATEMVEAAKLRKAGNL
jgi:nanoRNase/pAp phosphatase (c-di-AMP/oligoRNAs hydrolase)